MRSFLQKRFFTLFLFLTAGIAAKAQLQARFTASKTGGCSPLVVSFTDQTSGAGLSAMYQWDFGNGNTSTEKNPSAIYTEEKAYTVTLTVTDGSLKSTYTQTVSIYKKPTFSISADIAKGCAPLVVSLKADVAAGDGTVQSWFWDFGDGQTSSGSNLSDVKHTFTFAQQASVSLTVQNSFGCQATFVKDSLVNVLPALEASFEAQQKVLCRITDPVSFTNTSKGPGTLTYLWNFGDGSTSTAATPSHVYSTKGMYDVSLTVNSSEGCAVTKKLPAYVNAAGYQSDIILPDLSCTGKETKFTGRSTPQADFTVWDVEGNGSGWSPFGQHIAVYYFYTTGVNKVRMINTFGTCKDTVEKTFTIHKSPVLNGFIAERSTECGAPASVQFRDTAAGSIQWKWNFNCIYNCTTADATVQAPLQAFTYPAQHAVRLEVTNASGCSSTVIQTVDLSRPQMIIDVVSSNSNNYRYGCLGLNMKFKASRPADIKQYKWIFSDDNSTSTEAQPEHTFDKAGTFRVTLEYVLQNGCTGTATYDDIRVRAKPKVDFVSQSGTNICGNTPVKFVGTANENLYWYWNFGDGEIRYNYGGSGNNVEHKYQKEGVYTVSLVAWVDGCSDTLTKINYLSVKPPFPKIQNFQNTCDGTRGEVRFTDASRQAESWRWDFGDGSSLSYTTPPAEIKHTYTKTGSYMTVLTTTNGACTVKDSILTPVLLKQKPVIKSTQTTACSSKGIEFDITGLERNAQAYYNWAQYHTRYWEYADGRNITGTLLNLHGYNPGPDMKFNLIHSERGANQFRVILQSDYFHCLDTSNYLAVNFKGPVAGFTALPTFCSGNSVTFNDTSKGTGNIPLVSRVWSFGDGKQATYNNAGPVVHQYPYSSNFDVNLTVTDAEGCTDQKYLPYLRVGGVAAAFTPSANTVSPNTTVYFRNNTYDNYTNSTTYRWVFGDGGTSTERDPQYTYRQPGTYTVLLLATSATYGCTDTARGVIVVKFINSAFSFATAYLNNSSCPPVVVRFTNKSMNAANVSWDFGDGARAENVLHPTHLYTKPGTYRVTLRTYSDNGTEYTTIDSVHIRAAASTRLLTNKLMACTAGEISFAAPGLKAASYTWDFGDGRVKQTTDSLTVHHFSSAGIYRPSLVIIDTGGCVASARLDETVVIDSLQIAIGNLPSACNSAVINFQPVVNSVAGASQGQQVLRYHWDFGTGTAADTSNVKTPSFSYSKPGVYNVGFLVESPSGCSKKITRQVVVDEKIRSTITGPFQLCEGASAQFSTAAAAANVSWGWNFGQGGTAAVQQPPAQVYNQPGTYKIALTTTNGACTDTTFHQLEVHALPRISIPQRQLLLCSGSTLQLSANGGATYQWQPGTGLNNAAIASPVASPVVTTTYSVLVKSAEGCENRDSVRITVAPPLQMQLSPNAVICPGGKVQLLASGAATYQWISNTGGLSGTTIPNPVASPQATTTYMVKGTDSYDCFTDTAEVTVRVASLPTVNAGPDVVLSGGNTHALQPVYSTDVVNWTWTPTDYLSCSNCPLPVATPAGDVTYTVTVKNADGCSATDAVKMTTQCSESRIYIPNAFTPNGDAKNPLFRIKGSGVKQVTAFAIYNRWGEAVFEKRSFQLDDASAAWNGKQRGQPVPEGTYVYFASFQCASGEIFTKKGTVTVLY